MGLKGTMRARIGVALGIVYGNSRQYVEEEFALLELGAIPQLVFQDDAQ